MSEAAEYNAISSIWTGSDGGLLEQMLNFYPVIDAEPILIGLAFSFLTTCALIPLSRSKSTRCGSSSITRTC